MLDWRGLLKSSSAIGLDVGPSTVKLVELSRSRQGVVTLCRLGRAPLKTGAVVDGQIEMLDEVSSVVRALVDRCGVKTRRVVMALPTKNVILRRARFRADIAEDELALRVENEASGFVPFPVEELSLDFSVLGPAAGNASEIEVLIAAARRDRVEDRLALAESAGLDPLVVEVESNGCQLALQAWLRRAGRNPGAETHALLELGHESMSLKVFVEDEIAFEREQAWGARQLIMQVMTAFSLSEEEARLRQLRGELPAGYMAQMVPEHAERTAAEVDRMLQFFYAAVPGRRLHALLLAGGGAALEGLPGRIAARTGLSVSLINPFDHMDLGPSIEARGLSEHASSYLLACGLALRSFEA